MDNYNILKNFETKAGFTRHSIKISVSGPDIKRKIFEGCKKFKNLDGDCFMKKIFIKNDDPPAPLPLDTQRIRETIFKDERAPRSRRRPSKSCQQVPYKSR